MYIKQEWIDDVIENKFDDVLERILNSTNLNIKLCDAIIDNFDLFRDVFEEAAKEEVISEIESSF